MLKTTKQFLMAMLPAAMLMASCSDSKNDNANDEQATVTKPAAILDCDLGSSTDDLFALTMLYDAHQKG